jgi:nitrite reductase (NADH) large subunit
MTKEKLVVIGNGMAGCRAVEEVLKRDPDRYEIAIFGTEPRVNYNRIMLSPVLAGEKSFADIVINDEAWYADNAISPARRAGGHGGRPGRPQGGRRGRAGSSL